MSRHPKITNCLSAAINLSATDTAAFLSSFDAYTEAGKGQLAAAKSAATDLIASLQNERIELQAAVAEKTGGAQAGAVPTAESPKAGYSTSFPVAETQKDRSNSLADQRVSARNPTGARATEDPMGATRLQPGLEAMRTVVRKDGSSGFEYNLRQMAEYPAFRTPARGQTPDQIAEGFIGHMVNNLRWLYNNFDPALRERSKLWYVGANRMAHRWASKHGFTPEQIAGAIAVLSPQNHWFMNMSQAERILDILTFKSERAWTPEMEATARRILSGSKKNAARYRAVRGKTLREVWPDIKAMAAWIRVFDETYNDRFVHLITPEGNIGGIAQGETGKPLQAQWKTFHTIESALSVLADGSRKNISDQLGGAHKIRSFYNNIIAPHSDGGDVTIDTHAVAAAQLLPLAGSDREVAHNFGQGSPKVGYTVNSIVNGSRGTYGLYAEAYRRLAAELGILPREVQSVTWEAVRGLFEARNKKRIKAESKTIWERYHAGQITDAQAREELLQLAGRITTPSWAQIQFGPDAQGRDSTYAGELRQGGIPGREGPNGAAAARVRGVAALPVSNEPAGRLGAGQERGLTAESRRKRYAQDDRQLDLYLDRGPVESQAGPAGEKAQRDAVEAVRDLRSTETLLALALSRDFAARQRADLVGQRVSSPEDLATLAQVYRDQRFETLRVFFVDANDRVIAQVGVTQRMPASSRALIGADVDGYFSAMTKAAKDRGAKKFYLLHNHPSGLAQASRADVYLTQELARRIDLEFGSHVIIDTNQYVAIDQQGGEQVFNKDFGQALPYKAGEFTGSSISSPDDMMRIAKRIEVDADAVTLVTTNNQNIVTGITTVPAASLTGPAGRVRMFLHRAALKTGGAQVFAVSRSLTALQYVDGMVVDSVHVGEQGVIKATSDQTGRIGDLYRGVDRRPRLSPDTSADFRFLRQFGEAAGSRKVAAAEPAARYDTPEFRRWFAGSKVVDKRGRPLVVYHGSPDARFVDEDGVFATMKERMLRFGATPESRRDADERRAFFFTSSQKVARTYANPMRAFDSQSAVPGTVPTYLAIRNPLELDALGKHWREAQREISEDDFISRAKQLGHDGVIIRDVRDSYGSLQTGRDPLSDVFVAFDSRQIKHATRNNGQFDPANPDIRFSRAAGFFGPAESSHLFQRRDPATVRVVSNADADRALQTDATAKRILGKGNVIQPGDRVGVRLNINVLKKTGVAVNAIHAGNKGEGYTQNKGWWGGEVLTYAPIVTLRNAYFNVSQKAREDIAAGRTPKSPMASVDGEFADMTGRNFDGVEFRFNPKREHLFRDSLGRVLRRADEVTVTGSSAYARGNIEFYGPEDVPARAGDAPTEGVLMDPATMRFKRGGTGGLPTENVTRLANAIRATWANSPDVVVVRDMADQRIPVEVRAADSQQRSRGAAGEPEGFYYNGKVYLVAGQIDSPAGVVRVLSHEALGHYGLRGLFGGELGKILDQVANVRRSDVAAKLEEYGLPDTVDGRRIAAEEVLAVMAQTNPQAGFVRRAVAAIRQWLRDLGLNIQMTDADIVAQFIVPARQWVMRGGKAQAGGPVSFQRNGPVRSGTEEEARAQGFTLKAYRGVSASNPFSAADSTWATTSREVAEVYAEEVMGYDDPSVVEVMIRPDGLPRHDASRLTDQQREALGADAFGNPQAPGIYDRSDDHPLGGSRRNVTVIHAPNDAVFVVFDPANPDVRFSRRQDVSPIGFYSELARTIENGPARAPAADWKGWIRSQKGIKPDEIEWSGINEFLDLQQGKVTKEQVREYLSANGVRVQQVLLSDAQEDVVRINRALEGTGYSAEYDRIDNDAGFIDPDGDAIGFDELPDELQEVVRQTTHAAEGTTKFGQYTLPGGENYREVLLTLPVQPDRIAGPNELDDAAIQNRAQHNGRTYIRFTWHGQTYVVELGAGESDNDAMLRRLNSTQSRGAGEVRPFPGERVQVGPRFRSGHWDSTNVLAHLRLNDRVDADGKRVLFVEEIQSDWAQKGRKDGFGPQQRTGEVQPQEGGLWQIKWADGTFSGGYGSQWEAKEALRDRLSSPGVPKAPFVQKTDAWVTLAMKRIVRMAAEGGYDRVAFVTGEQAADRFQLSKQISALKWEMVSEGKFRISYIPLAEIEYQDGGIHAAKDLPDVVGKELADKIIEATRDTSTLSADAALLAQYGIRARDDYPGAFDTPEGVLAPEEFSENGVVLPPEAQAAVERLSRSGVFEGLDLEIGGDGMKKFYNGIVPIVAKDVLKKLGGGRMTTVTIGGAAVGNVYHGNEQVATKVTRDQFENDWGDGYRFVQMNDPNAGLQQPGFDVTPAMRDAVMSGGLPLFSRRPVADDVRRAAERGVAAARGTKLQGAWQSVVNAWTDLKPISLQLLGRRQIVEVYEGLLPQLRAHSNEMQQYDADKNESAAAADEIVNDWRKLKNKDALADVMHEATLLGFDPDVDVVETPQQQALVEDFAALGNDAQVIYRRARDAYRAHWEAVKQAIGDRIARADIAEAERRGLMEKYRNEFLQPLSGVYFPLARFGDYVITATNSEGQRVVVFAEKIGDAQIERARMMDPASGLTDVGEITLRKEYSAARDSVSKDFVRQLFEAVDKTTTDEVQAAALKDSINQLYLTSLPDVSWAKHGLHRKGTPGFNKDARRAFANNMFHGGYYLSKLRHADVLGDQLEAMQELIGSQSRNPEFDSVTAQQVLNEMRKRYDATMNPDSNALANKATALGFIWYLGASPASAMVNLSQTALVAYPIISAKYGHGATAAELTKAAKQAVEARNDFRGRFSEDENAAIDRAIREGLIDITQAHDLAGIAEGRDTQLGGAMSPVMRVASKLFHEAEKFNRQVTFIAAYRLAKAKGEASDSAYDIARDLTYQGHFDYAQSNRARVMMGPLARTLLLFKQYGQNMIYTIARNAYLSAKGDRQAMKTLSGVLVAHGLAAGTLGLPLSSVLFGLASMIGSDDDDPWDAEVAYRNYLADAIGKGPAEVVAKGVFRALLPGDISGRVGLDSLLIRDIDMTLDPNRVYRSLLDAVLGPVFGIPVNMVQGASEIARGDVARGMERMLPKAISDGLKTVRYGTEGVKDATGIDILDDVTFAEMLSQFAGFSPARAREAYDGRRAVYDRKTKLDNRREELLRDFSRGVIKKDDEARLEAIQEIMHFNQSNPTMVITRESMLRSVQNRMRRQAEAQNGIYLPRKQRRLVEEGRFANTE